MTYTIIEVPDKNDSFISINLEGSPYRLRFTWNDTGRYWLFGIYDTLKNPIWIGKKLVPNVNLSFFCPAEGAPAGNFAVITNEARLDRYAFVEDRAQFIYVTSEELERAKNGG